MKFQFRQCAKIAAFGFLTLAPVAAQSENLAQALTHAYQHSGLLVQNRALLRAADEDVAASAAALRPVINYAISGNYSSLTQSSSANLGLSASILLFDSGSSKLRRELAKQNVMSLREALRGVEQQVLLRAVAAFTSVRRDGAIVRLRGSNLELIQQELQAAKDRFEVGEITRTDVAFAEARLAAARAAEAAARGNLQVSREEYRAAIGEYPAGLEVPPSPPATAASALEAQMIARHRHPDMAQAQRSVNVAELNVQLAQTTLKPVLTGNAEMGVLSGGIGGSTLGITLSGPISSGGALASAIRKANAQRDATRAGLHLTRHAIDQAVSTAWARLAVAQAGLRANDEQIRASRVAFRGVKEEAALGARTTLDVLNAEQELLDAQAARISADSDRYVAVYNLLSTMGLLSTQHLGLGIATYDPSAYYDAVKNGPTYLVSPQGEKLDLVLKALGKQ